MYPLYCKNDIITSARTKAEHSAVYICPTALLCFYARKLRVDVGLIEMLCHLVSVARCFLFLLPASVRLLSGTSLQMWGATLSFHLLQQPFDQSLRAGTTKT